MTAALFGAEMGSETPLRVNYWTLGVLVVLTAALIVVGIVLAVRARRRLRTPPTMTLEQDLAWYQELHRRGEISKREYQRIMAVLADKRLESEDSDASHIQRLDPRDRKSR